ncbi:NAD(+) kinase [Porticoccaceae bacterium]|mgnify:FL=1|jgi:NAD+ kinase|nr:NAD(+) kinase [Porticoccaceae bacterium]MDB9844245.1 NAD(+) kinase [Porticoccaceae bacterium]MDC0133747.1 NAD(+) kinase [Porticoccaceae bacterium]CAI8372684.1 MAG: NAD kinase [SAR92 bacterium MED-G29]|tara:strand:- start:12270 stop:13166 length:897 start_codon:yes stop_codon:yes gene_type:complete
MSHFQRIGLLGSLTVPEVKESLQKLETFLLAQGREVVYEEQAASLVDWPIDKVLPIDEFPGAIDLGIVVGGDGSMLSACRKMAVSGIPLLGINRGRLGFLTDISPDEIEERVWPVLQGEYKQTKRFLLETTVTRNGVEIGTGTAVNDIVMHPGMSVRMMSFELYVDGEFVYSQRSDGLIVATPTGSTAYALSAGGPLLFPELDAMVVVPLNPHTLNSRPIVLQGNAKIEIRVSSRNELHPLITCDGHNDFVTEPGDVITIQKHDNDILLIHPKDNNFYGVCRSKLGWGSRLGVKKTSD